MPSKTVLWSIVAAALMGGTAAGIGSFTFIYAHGDSYLGNDPKSCANCHIMGQQYDGWIKSSHHAVATCNDCHTPHNFVGKWTVKALNGWHHSLAFTMQNFHEPIMISPRNLAIAEASCRHCHQEIVSAIDPIHGALGGDKNALSCIKCHPSVGHME